MLTPGNLDVALSNHDNEMALCEQRRCDWALLHLVLAYPDICSGLQVTTPGVNIGQRYRAWCNQFVKTPHLTGAEWWAMRNAVLHQGSAAIKKGCVYSRFEFSVADPPDHARQDGTVLHLDVVRLAAEVKAGVASWKTHLPASPPAGEATIVAQALKRVAIVYVPPPAAPATTPPRTRAATGGPYFGAVGGTGQLPVTLPPTVFKTK